MLGLFLLTGLLVSFLLYQKNEYVDKWTREQVIKKHLENNGFVFATSDINQIVQHFDSGPFICNKPFSLVLEKKHMIRVSGVTINAGLNRDYFTLSNDHLTKLKYITQIKIINASPELSKYAKDKVIKQGHKYLREFEITSDSK